MPKAVLRPPKVRRGRPVGDVPPLTVPDTTRSGPRTVAADPASISTTLGTTIDGVIATRLLRLNDAVTFGRTGNAQRFIVDDGWHEAEDDHRWTARAASLVVFDARFEMDAVLKVDLVLMKERAWSHLSFEVSLNGHVLDIQHHDTERDRISMRLAGLLRPSGVLNVLVFHSNVGKPSELFESSDDRVIGVGVKQFWLSKDV